MKSPRVMRNSINILKNINKEVRINNKLLENNKKKVIREAKL